jgi:hypothetical protein
MTEQTEEALWMSGGGELSCSNHLGMTASGHLKHYPDAGILPGISGDRWHKMKDREINDMWQFIKAHYWEQAYLCESCQARHDAKANS